MIFGLAAGLTTYERPLVVVIYIASPGSCAVGRSAPNICQYGRHPEEQQWEMMQAAINTFLNFILFTSKHSS